VKEKSIASELHDAESAAAQFANKPADALEAARVKIEKHIEHKESQFKSDMKRILSVVEGRRVLYRILEIHKPNAKSFIMGQSDLTSFNEGARSVTGRLLDMINDADEQAYIKMLNEHISDIKNDAKRLNEAKSI
jgi:hypothetical protein